MHVASETIIYTMYRQRPSAVSTGVRRFTLQTPPCTDHLDPPALTLAKFRANSYLSSCLSSLSVQSLLLPFTFLITFPSILGDYIVFTLDNKYASREICCLICSLILWRVAVPPLLVSINGFLPRNILRNLHRTSTKKHIFISSYVIKVSRQELIYFQFF